PHIMTIAKGLSSGYAPIGGSIVCDEVAEVINACEFNHGYTYSGHPVCAAVALENLRIMQEENIVDHVRDVAAPALKEALDKLGEHPLVGGVNVSGLMASLPLTPDKESRAQFADGGVAGYTCREHCFANNLVMRHVGDRMIISPPLVITPEEIKIFAERATKALDATYADLKDKDVLKAAS
ncbi:MAG TPA: aspartate aminotransferase family protein, partial [Sulfitobacter sp.]|nr:aspartate aminotransferase family protein [Sulfitobacter sp.]